jgi:hypothetical protein
MKIELRVKGQKINDPTLPTIHIMKKNGRDKSQGQIDKNIFESLRNSVFHSMTEVEGH